MTEYQQYPQQQYAQYPVSPPPQRDNTTRNIIIAVVVLVVLCCCCALIAGFGLSYLGALEGIA
jgi:hypothetical protein